jgi:hypothetical protein
VRLSRGPYLLIWLLVTGAQVYALSQASVWEASMTAGVLLGGQLLKMVNTIPRLSDLGRAWDDSVFALLPLVNIGLWLQLNKATPSEARRLKNRATWENEPTAAQAFVRGLAVMARNPVPVLIAIVTYGIAGGFVETLGVDGMLSWLAENLETSVLIGQGLFLLFIFQAIYLFLQISKRKTATRESWWPTVLMPATLALGVAAVNGGSSGLSAEQIIGTSGSGDPILPYMMGSMGLSMMFGFLATGLLSTLWVALAMKDREQSLGLVPTASVGQRVRQNWLGVAVANGAASLLIMVGMLILVPGVIYALQYAFVSTVTVANPDGNSLRDSSEDSRPVRRRLFKILFFSFLTDTAFALVSLAVFASITGAELLTSVGLGFGWVIRQFPASSVGVQPTTAMVIMGLSVIFWGAARIGIANTWLIRSKWSSAPTEAEVA